MPFGVSICANLLLLGVKVGRTLLIVIRVYLVPFSLLVFNLIVGGVELVAT